MVSSVVLRDGSVVPENVVASTVANLEKLFKESPEDLFDLVQKCKKIAQLPHITRYTFSHGERIKIFQKDVLQKYNLTNKNGELPRVVQKIILNAVIEDNTSLKKMGVFISMKIINPVMPTAKL